MTTEQKLKAVEMRLNGATLEEIANKLGCTRQNISCEFKNIYKCMTTSRYQKISGIIYKGIAAWLLDNGKKVSDFASMVCEEYTPRKSTYFYKKLCGQHNLNMKEIKKILEVTGMTFEECFEERELENV